MRKNLQEKEESHEVLSPFEYITVVIFQALILTLNAFETSCGIDLWTWIGESVLQTMQCLISDRRGYAFFFYAAHVDDTLRHLYLQFLVVPQAMLIKMIQLGSVKRIQGERKISIRICAKALNKEICAKELNKKHLKSLMETCFVMACQI